MPEAQRSKKVPEFLREPFEATQARLEAFEEEAQRMFKDLMQKGRESRKDFADLVQRLSKQDWKMDELRGRLDRLRDTGKTRASALRGRAETFRAEAFDKLEDLQTKAIEFLGVASREQVLELSRELEKLARRLDRDAKPKAKKAAKRAARG
jgi:SMC interacting uncharacterized protein involved in chromosome segregation